MSTLVIIGNGFDLWHKLPTRYKDFYDAYSINLEEHTQYFNDFYEKDVEWAYFEESLGSFDHDSFLKGAAYLPSIEEMMENRGMLYGYEDSISDKKDELIESITQSFNKWIASIKVNAAKKKMKMPNDCKFINFNYTTTLQDIYNITDSDILHIHGKTKEKIIFGHGKIKTMDDRDLDRYDPWFDDPRNNAKSISDIFHKPVHEILQRNKTRLKSYKNLKKIIVIGHSINDIDVPYFQFLSNEYPEVKWKNYNYGDEIQNTHERLIQAGVPKNNLSSDSTENLGQIYPSL